MKKARDKHNLLISLTAYTYTYYVAYCRCKLKKKNFIAWVILYHLNTYAYECL